MRASSRSRPGSCGVRHLHIGWRHAATSVLQIALQPRQHGVRAPYKPMCCTQTTYGHSKQDKMLTLATSSGSVVASAMQLAEAALTKRRHSGPDSVPETPRGLRSALPVVAWPGLPADMAKCNQQQL